MSALTSLTDEHQLIGELLGALQTYATRLRSGATVDPADLVRFSEVFRELVDYRHHEKEEGVLLPFLARNGFDWSKGLLAELHREHGHLRYLLDVLGQAAARDAGQSREQRRQVAEAAGAFIDFKRRHMQKEESALMPAILQRLSPSALEQLRVELAQFDEGRASMPSLAGSASAASASAASASAASASAASASAGSALAGSAPIYTQASELIQRYSEDSATVDVTGVQWAVGAKPADVAPQDSAFRALREAAGAAFTSFGRSR
jgi:hemerythrin-like domain-containing protein